MARCGPTFKDFIFHQNGKHHPGIPHIYRDQLGMGGPALEGSGRPERSSLLPGT